MIKKTLYVVGGLVLVALLVLVARPRPPEVEVTPVARGPFRLTVDEDGKTRVRERYTLSAPVAGTLARIELHAGDAVEPGTVVASLLPLASPLLDPRAREVAEQHLASARDAHSQAETAIARAESASDLARHTLERDRRLVEQQAMPAAQFEEAESQARIQDAELRSLRFAEKVAAHAVEEAQLALQRFTGRAGEGLEIRSPVHGTVLHVLHESEGVVAAGAALIEIGDPASLEVVVQVLSQDAVNLRPGMTATLSHWGGEAELHAHVRRVEPVAFTHLSALGVEEQRVDVLLDLDDGSAVGKLGDGFAVEAQILAWSGQEVTQVPTSALFRSSGGWAVFVVEQGRVRARPVKVGHRGPLWTEIAEGVSTGDLIVGHPPPTLKAGTRVKAVR